MLSWTFVSKFMSENTALSKYQFLLQFKFMDQKDKNIITTTSFNVQSPNNQAYSFSPALQFTKKQIPKQLPYYHPAPPLISRKRGNSNNFFCILRGKFYYFCY